MPTEHEVTIAEAVVLLEALTEANDSVHLWGAPGIGKTEITHQLGARKKRKVLEFHAALRETVDLRGIPVPDLITGTTRWLIPDELPNAARDGEEGYFFCDEMNQASQQMQGVLGGLVLDGKIGDYRLPRGWRVIAAGNRVTDRAAAQRMPTHMRNRFAHIFIKPDVPAWCAWANANNVAPEVVAFVRLRQELLHQMPKGDENAFPTPRSITKAAKYVGAPDSVRMRLFASLIGDGAAAELDGFIALYKSIGSLEEIVRNPDNAPIPSEPSLRYAVATGLGRLATRRTFANVVRYAARLNRESEVLLVSDATSRDASLKNLACYSDWAIRNQNLTVQ